MLTGTAHIKDSLDDFQFERYIPLNDLFFDITNYWESIGSFVGCMGPLSKRLEMKDDEVVVKTRNWCISKTQKRPYAQLGSVDVHNQCGMCFTIGSDLAPVNEKGEGGMALGWGCDEATTRQIVTELQSRKEKRGNIAQIRKLDYLFNRLISSAQKAPLLLHNLGNPYLPETLPEEEQPKAFPTETFDMTNWIEMLCGCVKKDLVLDREEATLTITDLCNSRTQKREYAQLGSVERKKGCFCCYAVTSDLGALSPGLGCDKTKVEACKASMTERMIQRGNVGQIQKQERMLKQVGELYKELPKLAESFHCEFPPGQTTMEKNCGAKAPSVKDAPPDEVNDIAARKEPIDVTNTCESICGLLCTCGIQGLTTQKVTLEDAHIVIKTKNNCDDSEVKLPYAQLGSVDMNKSCCCCWGVNDFVPGCGCSKALVEDLHNELQARKVKRGNIAQVKQLEKMQWQSFVMDSCALDIVEKEGMAFPPNQNTMQGSTWPNGQHPMASILEEKVAHFDPAVKFDLKDYEITNYCESFWSCICCCGPTKTTMQLQQEEMLIAKENWCFTTTSRTPYAQLGSVETEEVCGCFSEIPDVAKPGFGCQKEMVTQIASDLQERKVKRGNIAQLKMQENLIYSAIKLDAKLDMMMKKRGIEYPPSSQTMTEVFGKVLEVKAPGGSFVQASSQQMQVTVPPGVSPAQPFQVQNPSGGVFQVFVPPGVQAGQTILVQVPSSAPTPSVVGIPSKMEK
jgi:hypothetical protein|mmetsp:Transcript_124576/g.195212  ORF Transcript_124576/g.195212 Transcript_124576/m.195212 type:complete len:739 (-) Transcript_124576:90-2306(-)